MEGLDALDATSSVDLDHLSLVDSCNSKKKKVINESMFFFFFLMERERRWIEMMKMMPKGYEKPK